MTDTGKITVKTLQKMKQSGELIAALTAYDFFTASFLDSAGTDIILIGDSVEMVLYGAESTLTANMQKMLFHTEAVARAVNRALVIADMPFLSYQTSLGDAIQNAGELLQAGASAVKIEGGWKFAPVVRAMVDSGIPVMGHIGMLPQSFNKTGGYFVQGKDEDSARQLMEDASALQEAGAFSIVIEKVAADTAAKITESLEIPTIGIGAGAKCDGQILVVNDILGLFDKFTPPFVKKYADLKPQIINAAKKYIEDVKGKKFK